MAVAGTSPGAPVSSMAVTIENSAPVAGSVWIVEYNGGTQVVGATLTGNYIYSDIDNDPEGVSTFRWLRDGTPIAGATAKTYTLIASDIGPAIRFEVTPVATYGTSPGRPVISAVAGSVRLIGELVGGNYAYVADVDWGLRIIDISDPTALVETGFVDTPGWAQGVAIMGNYVYVADSSAGFEIYEFIVP